MFENRFKKIVIEYELSYKPTIPTWVFSDRLLKNKDFVNDLYEIALKHDILYRFRLGQKTKADELLLMDWEKLREKYKIKRNLKYLLLLVLFKISLNTIGWFWWIL